MSKVVRKYFFPWQENKEKAFLQEMAKKGFLLSETHLGSYTFDEIKPADLIFEIDYKGQHREDNDEYLQICEDAGWNMVAKKGDWFYFCKERLETENIHFFNDNNSMLRKYLNLLLTIGATWFLMVFFIFQSSYHVKNMTDSAAQTMIIILISCVLLIPIILFLIVWFKYHKLKSNIKE